MKGLWWFITLQWWRFFTFEGQDPVKKVVVNLFFDPLQGQEKRVRRLVKKFFPLTERVRVMQSIVERDGIFFDTSEHARKFIKELSKIISLDKNRNAPRPLGQERLFEPREQWYWHLSEMFYCTSCRKLMLQGSHEGTNHDCGINTDVHPLTDLSKKELKRAVETHQKKAA